MLHLCMLEVRNAHVKRCLNGVQWRMFFTTILCSILIFSCEPEGDTIPTSGIDKGLYPFLFDTGSYWVYKDSVTGSLDSTIVTSIERKIIGTPTVPGGKPKTNSNNEMFEIRYVSYPTNTKFFNILIGGVMSEYEWWSGCVYLSGKQIGLESERAKINKVLDVLSVEGNEYHDVVQMRIRHPNDSSYLYYADGVGLIKKQKIIRDTITETSNLLRYNTILRPY